MGEGGGTGGGNRFDDLDKRWEDRAYRTEDRFERAPVRTGFGWFLKLCVGLVALSLLGGLIFGLGSWVSGWGGEAKRITGADNSRQQTTAVLDDWNSMKATAGNACDAQNSKSNADSPTLVEDPAFAYKAQYRRIKADYDRRMNNLYEAAFTRHIPLPDTLHGFPREAPTLREAMANEC